MKPSLSQSTRHVLYLPVIFDFRCDFYAFRWFVTEIIFELTSTSKHPSGFINSRHVLFPIRFLSSSSISLKYYIWIHANFKASTMFYIYLPICISNIIFILLSLISNKTKYLNSCLSQTTRLVLYLPVRFDFRYDLYSPRRLVNKNILTCVYLKEPVIFYIYLSRFFPDAIFLRIVD